jgi:hypothetical protein
MTNKDEFEQTAEGVRATLRKRGAYGSCSDLYVNKEYGVAVIGIQTSYGGQGHDTVYVLRKNNQLEEILDEHFEKGRMFPTGISKDGKKIFYTIKDESGDFHKSEYSLE